MWMVEKLGILPQLATLHLGVVSWFLDYQPYLGKSRAKAESRETMCIHIPDSTPHSSPAPFPPLCPCCDT